MIGLPKKFLTTRYKNLILEIQAQKPRIILELGVWSGETGIQLIKSASQFRNDVLYIGIDLWEKITPNLALQEHHTKRIITYDTAKRNFLKHVTQKHWLLLQGLSFAELERLRKSGRYEALTGTKYLDFVFVDGGHSCSTIMKDWMVIQSMMDENTVIIFDDYYPNTNLIGARNIVEFIIKQGEFNVEYLEPIDHFKFPDGSPQPTQMVKVTRR